MMSIQIRVLGMLTILGCVVGSLASDVGAGETLALFDGKSLDGWAAREPRDHSLWRVGLARVSRADARRLAISSSETSPGVLINNESPGYAPRETRGVDLYTERTFGNCTIELEFMVPEQANSGVYVMGEYEVQIKDSYGKDKLTFQDLGAIYKVAPARVNAARKPGEWQSLRIAFCAPRFENGKKVTNARFVNVVLNDQVIHENVELSDVTPGGLTGKEVATGPLMFQGDHGPVAFRNIRVTITGRGLDARD